MAAYGEIVRWIAHMIRLVSRHSITFPAIAKSVRRLVVRYLMAILERHHNHIDAENECADISE